MEEKTAELRDIFLDLAEDSTLTERQEESRGSLVADSDSDIQLRKTVEQLQSQCECDTSLSTDQLVTVIKRFYAGDSDTEIAQSIGDGDAQTITTARIAIHLLVDEDTNAPFDLVKLRDRMTAGQPTDAIAEEFDVSPTTVRHYQRVITTIKERRRVNDRFRAEYERILADRELSDRLTKDVRETGLDDATDGMETNVSF